MIGLLIVNITEYYRILRFFILRYKIIITIFVTLALLILTRNLYLFRSVTLRAHAQSGPLMYVRFFYFLHAGFFSYSRKCYSSISLRYNFATIFWLPISPFVCS